MTQSEIAAIICVARRAPLANMAEAEALSRLLQKLSAHFAPKQEADGTALRVVRPDVE